MGKNDYLARQKVKEGVIKQATRQTYEQYMTDTLILTLNDPEVMGKDTFGYERLMKVLAAWGKTYDTYYSALTKDDEANYCRTKMDEAIKRIMGGRGDFKSFEERYEYLPEITYGKK